MTVNTLRSKEAMKGITRNRGRKGPERRLIATIDRGESALILELAPKCGVPVAKDELFGVYLEGDAKGIAKVFRKAGKLITRYHALRLRALVDVLESADIDASCGLRSEAEALAKAAESGALAEIKVAEITAT